MKQYLTMLALVAAAFTTTVHAADCAATATEKKLSGAAKTSYMKKCMADNPAPAAMAAPMVDKAADASPASCDMQANNKKLAGAARTSFIGKCTRDTKGASVTDSCNMKAAEKKLAGAAKSSFTKKCVADGAAA
ncbi:MAG: hypothetical protein JWQ11_4786 [Rhizobacter sp.]|nr:hypothetical protein [Rhizobacter sp.]